MSTFATLDGLRDLGFSGFLPFRALLDCLGEIPAEPGVYVVAAPPGFVPRWREVGSGGHFKGEDPNVPQSRLSGKWVPGAAVLYFGKAGAGATGRRGLRRRLEEYARFGGGAPKAEVPAPTTEHAGFTIHATPYEEQGQWQMCGVIEKEVGGEAKSQRFIRADRFPGKDTAIEMTFMKARQIIDQQGDRLFG
ncbi:MAG: HlyU family transcriptional regulator [Aestuariivirga sp.]